ncbi:MULTISPECIES: hypothetical protein [unclassified Streptomyces]|uniref:hypothetical protein n=1 Tax=unclassified Streptomyces TaxID=2593676 RepID=UPI000B803931|nr:MULTISPECIES: hypothetical protein [unclassified Streptomyces]MYS21003.1 hypothetical protein [Streptomyces sp. SID4948]
MAVLILLALFVLLGAVPGVSAAHAEPPGPGTWVYAFTEFTATPAATDYDHRTVTLTGRLLRHRGWGGPAEPAAGETVDLAQSAAGTQPSTGASTGNDKGTGTATGIGAGATGDPVSDDDPADGVAMGTVTTDPQGRFQLQNAVVDQRADPGGTPVPGPYTVTIAAVHHSAADPTGPTAGVAGTGGDEVRAQLTVTATPSTAHLTVDYQLGPVSAAGWTVTARGAYLRDTDQGPRPLAGAAVQLEYRPIGGRPLVEKSVTGADGRFSIAFAAAANGTVSTVALGTPDPYLDPVAPSGIGRPIVVPQPTPSAAPSPTATAPQPVVPVVRPVSATPAPNRLPEPSPASTATARKAVQPVDEPHRLAATGDGTPRAAFLTGGITLLAAGLVLMVARRRMRSAP